MNTKTYEVKVQKDGKVWTEEVHCGDTFQARRVAAQRVPEAVILDVRERK